MTTCESGVRISVLAKTFEFPPVVRKTAYETLADTQIYYLITTLFGAMLSECKYHSDGDYNLCHWFILLWIQNKKISYKNVLFHGYGNRLVNKHLKKKLYLQIWDNNFFRGVKKSCIFV